MYIFKFFFCVKIHIAAFSIWPPNINELKNCEKDILMYDLFRLEEQGIGLDPYGSPSVWDILGF